jgi:uncharacterized protein DUF6368
MAGPGATVLVTDDTGVLQSWREVMTPIADEWMDGSFCWISDSYKFGGTYRGEPRPFVGGIESLGESASRSWRSDEEVAAIRMAMDRVFTHSIGIAAMCNGPEDHRLLCEVACHVARVHNGIIDFDILDIADTSHGAQKCFWSEDGMDCWTLLGTPDFCERWLSQDSFHMVK